MCGITGILASEEITDHLLSQVKASVKTLKQRGPDASGIKNFPRAVLGHRRLSILDTSEQSNQPFQDETKRYTLVFNGEIYNYQSIRKELEEKGIQFKTKGDTEVVLKAYIQYGTAFLNKLDGFFGLAIYDQEEDSCLLARDRFGIKPLLFYKSDGLFAFASEMKALLQLDIPREIDFNSLYTYLQLNYIPEPHSILKDVKKLEPGHYLKIDSQRRLQSIPFFQLEYDPSEQNYTDLSYDQAKDELERLLEESVQNRLVSDVPLGTFLSGGIDSSLITALASKHKKV